jgi:hypothetical protein
VVSVTDLYGRILGFLDRKSRYTVFNMKKTIVFKIIMFLGSKVRRVCRAYNLTTICEPIN